MKVRKTPEGSDPDRPGSSLRDRCVQLWSTHLFGVSRGEEAEAELQENQVPPQGSGIHAGGSLRSGSAWLGPHVVPGRDDEIRAAVSPPLRGAGSQS